MIKKLIKNICIVLMSLFIISFILIESLIVINMEKDKHIENVSKVNNVIVLGAKVYKNKPSSILQERLDKTIEYYQKNKDINIIVSGGKSKNGNLSESTVMYSYLIKNGIPKNIIIEEKNATSTFENIIYSKKLLKNINEKVLIITSDFHLKRAEYISSIIGLKNEGLCSITPVSNKIKYMIREYPATIKDILKSIVYKISNQNKNSYVLGVFILVCSRNYYWFSSLYPNLTRTSEISNKSFSSEY